MNRSEALQLLGFNKNDKPDEKQINKAFKKKAAKLHPDVNKSSNAEDEFKKLNNAKDLLLKKDVPAFPDISSIFNSAKYMDINETISDFFSSFKTKNNNIPPNINYKLSLSFKESVLGCKKDINLDKYDMCDQCNGISLCESKDTCPSCKGSGFKSFKKINIGIRMTCKPCRGTGKKLVKCKNCNSSGAVKVKKQASVEIPGGAVHNQHFRIPGAGNFVPERGYGNLIINIIVEKDDNMSLVENDVISTIRVSLYDAIKGTTVKAKTIHKEILLIVKAMSRHGDKIVINGQGVPQKGNHIFVLDVYYPDDIQELVNLVKEGK